MLTKIGAISLKIVNKELVINILQPVSITLPLNLDKFLIVLLRLIKDTNGKSVISFQSISDIFEHPGRQWSNNIYKEWELAGANLKLFLEDKRELSKEILNLITEFVLVFPLCSILELHRKFQESYPQHKMCINSFCFYVSAMDCCKLLTAIGKQLMSGKLNPRSTYFIKVLLAQGKKLAITQRAYISDLFDNDINDDSVINKDIDWQNGTTQKHLLVSLLYTFGVAQSQLALLFGVSKTTIHNWVHGFCDISLQAFIIKMIGKWSGKICVDEKWIKVNGNWQYIFSAVDAVSGMPLFVKRFSSADTAAWTAFFKEFKQYYGDPVLITSDGSKSLMAARKIVFLHVRHQLCWFHKLKNLYKRIYTEIQDSSIRTRALSLANGMFHNKHVSSRKHAAKQLSEIAGESIKKYLTKSIFNLWKRLTLCLTSNAAERFNRKIEKCVASRYGIKNEACADVLIRGLWFSEILIKGKMHWADNTGVEKINLPLILKNNFDGNQIIHFLQQSDVQTLKKSA